MFTQYTLPVLFVVATIVSNLGTGTDEAAPSTSNDSKAQICCLKNAYCCSVKAKCCSQATTEASATTQKAISEPVLAQDEAARSTLICCQKRAYCCTIAAKCCNE